MSKIMTRTSALVVMVLLALTAVACGGGNQPVPDQPAAKEAPAPKDRSVVLYQYKFNPNTLTIPAGTKVTFKNKDPERHNINIAALNVDENLDPNQTFTYTFDTRGEFAVSNRFANNPMKLTIIVE